MVYGCEFSYVWVFHCLVYGFIEDVRVLHFEMYGS